MGYNAVIGSCSLRSPCQCSDVFSPSRRGFFIGWLGYLSINTKEQTQRVMSLDRKAVEMARMRKCWMDIELKKFDDQEGK